MIDTTARELDLICLGRINLDLYAEQEGAPLGDVQSFHKYVGGSAANVCIGTARLGLQSAMVGRVGNEQMGAFVRRTIAAEGADVRHLRLDPDRLTGVVTVGVRESEGFPRIFFYEDTADLATDETDIDADYIATSKGFAVGRGIFADPARRWLADELTDDDLVEAVSGNYARFITTWYQHKETA